MKNNPMKSTTKDQYQFTEKKNTWEFLKAEFLSKYIKEITKFLYIFRFTYREHSLNPHSTKKVINTHSNTYSIITLST